MPPNYGISVGKLSRNFARESSAAQFLGALESKSLDLLIRLTDGWPTFTVFVKVGIHAAGGHSLKHCRAGLHLFPNRSEYDFG
jgi:hypothetical protein